MATDVAAMATDAFIMVTNIAPITDLE